MDKLAALSEVFNLTEAKQEAWNDFATEPETLGGGAVQSWSLEDLTQWKDRATEAEMSAEQLDAPSVLEEMTIARLPALHREEKEASLEQVRIAHPRNGRPPKFPSSSSKRQKTFFACKKDDLRGGGIHGSIRNSSLPKEVR